LCTGKYEVHWRKLKNEVKTKHNLENKIIKHLNQKLHEIHGTVCKEWERLNQSMEKGRLFDRKLRN